MLVVNRFRVEPSEADDFRAGLERALAALAERPGYADGRIGRNIDEPALWTLVTRWADTGSYRRALSAYDVKVHAVPLLGRAIDEPSAYEGLEDDGELNRPGARDLSRPRTGS